MRSAVIMGGAALVAVALVGCSQANSVSAGSARVSATSNSSPPAQPPAATYTAASTGAVTTSVDNSEVHSKADARARADADLAAVRLPAGAVGRPTAPNPQLTVPPHSSEVATMVDGVRWWNVPGSLASVKAYIERNPPCGLPLGGWGGVKGGPSELTFRKTVAGSDNSHDEIEFSLLEGGGSVDVRADAQVIWLTPKSPYDTIAPGAGPAALAYTGPGGTPRRTLTLTDSELVKLASAINGLELLPPGPAWSCPMDTGAHAVLILHAGGHTQAFDIQLAGCRFTTVIVDGAKGDTLTASETPQALVRQYAGAEPPASTAPRAPTSSLATSAPASSSR